MIDGFNEENQSTTLAALSKTTFFTYQFCLFTGNCLHRESSYCFGRFDQLSKE